MKIKTLYFFGLALIVASCVQDEPSKKFTFVVQGNVRGGEGHELALRIAGRNVDDRMITKVTNGKFEFTGELDYPEHASIMFEKEISDFDGSWFNYHIILERDTVKLRSELVTDAYNPYFKNDSVIGGSLTRHYRKSMLTLDEVFGPVVFKTSDSTYMDSLRKNVLPPRRNAALDTYETLVQEKEHAMAGVRMLRYMLDRNLFFPYEDLTSDEKKRLTGYFQQIDTTISSTADYKIVSLLIDKLNSESKAKTFKDFTLPGIDGTDERLSEIIKRNKLTVLDFWWFGCVPCRKFNRDTRGEYALLKSHGIEIVGINTDGSAKKWKEASAQDSIVWVNLYAGEKAPIEIAYDVSYAPFKVGIDNNFNVVDVDVKKITDLIPLVTGK